MTNQNMYASPQANLNSGAAAVYDPKIFSTSGRIGRMRYILYSLMLNAISLGIIGVVFAAMFSIGSDGSKSSMGVMMILYPVVLIPVLVFAIIFAKRRLNDFNQTGWLALLFIIPLVNVILSLMLLFAPGTKASNKYGPMPSDKNAAIINGTAIVLLIIVIAGSVMSSSMFESMLMQSQMVK